MANNKVQLSDGTVIMDVTDTTAEAADVASGKYFYGADGVKTQGTASGAVVTVTEEPDANGGTIKNITAINISDTTAVASDVASGKVFYTANGTRTTGSSSAIVPSGTISITQNGTVDVESYASASVNVPTGITPTGTISITQNGTVDVTNYASASVNVSGGGGMNMQVYIGNDYARATSYTATDVSLTVEKTGTYTVSWIGWRSTSSGTSGSQLYINGTAYGSAYTTFSQTYGQNPVLTNVSLSAGDVLVVRARARNSSSYMTVGNLIIEQTA